MLKKKHAPHAANFGYHSSQENRILFANDIQYAYTHKAFGSHRLWSMLFRWQCFCNRVYILTVEIVLICSKLFVWFVAVISLCAVSLLANLFLIYLACNQATRSALWSKRVGERELLFGAYEDDSELWDTANGTYVTSVHQQTTLLEECSLGEDGWWRKRTAFTW